MDKQLEKNGDLAFHISCPGAYDTVPGYGCGKMRGIGMFDGVHMGEENEVGFRVVPGGDDQGRDAFGNFQPLGDSRNRLQMVLNGSDALIPGSVGSRIAWQVDQVTGECNETLA